MPLKTEYSSSMDSRKRISIGKLASQIGWKQETKILQKIGSKGAKSIIVLEEDI